MRILLPACLNPISRRKDKSCKLSWETRELTPSETMTLMSMEGAEGWILFSTSESEIDDKEIPNEKPELGQKSYSERLRARIYVHYKQAVEDGLYVGLADNFYKEQMEKILEGYSKKNLREN